MSYRVTSRSMVAPSSSTLRTATLSGGAVGYRNYYGAGRGDVVAEIIARSRHSGSTPAKDQQVEVESHLVGSYNLQNLLAAANIGAYLGTSLGQMSNESYHPSNSRSQREELPGGSVLLLDAYNADPSSMKVALEGLASVHAEHKRWRSRRDERAGGCVAR